MLISEQMVTYHNGSFRKISIFQLSAGLKFFPGENAERESLNMLCAICMGFSLTVFRKVRKPFHYSNCFFFFFLHLGKWPIPSSQAQQYEQGRYSLRRGCNAQTRGEALLHSPRAGVNFWSLNNCQKRWSELWFLQSSLNSLIEKLWPGFTSERLYCLQNIQHLLHLGPKLSLWR